VRIDAPDLGATMGRGRAEQRENPILIRFVILDHVSLIAARRDRRNPDRR
jgi:hypothetical protein